MRESQRGFTLVELVVAVAITAVLLTAGGIWLGGAHPGALRAAADDFDADYAAAQAIAASSGNGATIAVLPRAGADGPHPGFELRIYSGRPNAANAVQTTSTMSVESAAAISEKTYGQPPFAVFLSSAGHPSGIASYPSVDAQGHVIFGVLAAQPPCPAGGIVLTFSNAQGAHDTRTLQCAVSVAGTAAPNPSPTPNVPVVSPTQLVAHWTSDDNALRFVAAEFGYTHWFASNTGNACGTAAVYNGGWPYSAAADPAETAIAPAPPSAPYSWPNASDMNDAPAAFAMSPIRGSPGLCAVDIVDDYGQHAGASVQVMGDLGSSPSSLTFAAPTSAAQNIMLSKSFDSEPIALKTTDNCAGIATYAQGTASTPPSPSAVPAQSALTVTPRAGGQCDIRIGDQYGEPYIDVPVTVHYSALAVWPQYVVYGQSGANVAMGPTNPSASRASTLVAKTINAFFGGAIANAADNCPAMAVKSDMQTPDTAPPAWVNQSTIGYYTKTAASPGCFNGDITANETGFAGKFSPLAGTCGGSVSLGSWVPSQFGPAAAISSAGTNPTSGCTFTLSDTNTSPQSQNVNAVVTDLAQCAMGASCKVGVDYEDDTICAANDSAGDVETTTGKLTIGSSLGTVWTDGSTFWFTRTAYGTATALLTTNWRRQALAPGKTGPVCGAVTTGSFAQGATFY